ncbi:hypothetical protein [Amycolatopsis speibonae]|uniref:Uncharacterized protein n=1 Tax=Amycolatopsis speibonae TaxID=1450224 RepID=A0ABV7P499_9PSEU
MSTKFDSDAIRQAAGNIGQIMSDMKAFEALKPHWPNAGKFELAVWLERLVDDRRNGVVAHAEHLKIAFSEIEKKLTAIANDFENADGENADKIKSSLGELESKVIGGVNAFDDDTEEKQHNYTADPGADNKSHAGDGYAQNLNEPVAT